MSGRALAVAAAMCAAALLFQFRPVRDVDMFWQVRTGEVMLETGRLVTADPFTSTHAGEPTPTIYWLSQLGYAAALRAGSWTVLHRLDAWLFAGALGLVAWRGTRAAPFPTAAAFGLALLVALPFHGLRPQTFAVAGFAALVVLDRSGWPLRWKLPAVLLLVTVWQNLHPSGATAVLYLGVRVVAEALAWRSPWPVHLLPNALLLAPAALALFLTPDGVGIIPLMRANADIATRLGVEEWLPAWHPATRAQAQLLWLAFGITAGLLARLGRRADLRDVVLVVGLGVAAACVYRLALFWALAALPVWAKWVAAALPNLDTPGPDRVPFTRPAAVALAVAAAVVPTLAGAWTFAAGLPFAGLAALDREQVSGTVYNYREWGGPLIYACPRAKVTIDGRLYLFPLADWVEYDRAARGEVRLAELVERHAPAAFVLRPGYHDPLIAELEASPAWRPIHVDDACAVFVGAGR